MRSPGAKPKDATSWTALTTFFATTTVLASFIAVGLAAVVVQRGGLSGITQAAVIGGPTTTAGQVDVVTAPGGRAATTSTWPAPPRPHDLGIGQSAANGDWTFVIDQAGFVSDPTANGWSRTNVTMRFENTGTRTSRLNIPASTFVSSSQTRSQQDGPNVMPLPALPAKSSPAIDGLRVLLRDSSGREFGGGFGSDLSSYDLIVAPGDILRLPYSFRYPSTSTGPFTIRLDFPNPASAGSYEIRLDGPVGDPAQLPLQPPPPELTDGTWQTVDSEWAVAYEGVDFGAGRSPGERPVTLHLKVKNMTDTASPALIDRDDPTGMSRDFYLVGPNGELAYSHVDTQPSVMVPAQETRDVSVELFTNDLASSTRPLTFTAILNWRTNSYLRFRLN